MTTINKLVINLNKLVINLISIIETAKFKHEKDKEIIKNVIWHLQNQEQLLNDVKKGTIK